MDAAKQLAVKGSLIPGGSSYVEQLQRFKAQCDKAGIHGVLAKVTSPEAEVKGFRVAITAN